jgi:hypothetical protein
MDGSGYIIESVDWNVTASCTTSGNSIPEIKITSPTTNSTYTSSQPSIKISGTASDQKGVSHIGWYIDSNNSGFVKSIGSGFSTWEANISKLKKGKNKVVITARNTAGKEESDILTITYAQPDLIITETKLKNAKSSYEVGDKVTVSATVQNQGKATADASTVRYYLSTGPRVDTNDTYLGSDSIPSLVANKSLRRSEYIYLPSNLGNATYYIGACVDVVTSEFSDSNNCTQGSGIAIKVKSSPIQKTLSIVAPSNGVIKDDTGKISCPSSCSANYDVNSAIKLTAIPNLNYVFTGFSGCTTNGNQCSFTLDNNKNISATFALSNPANKLTANVSREGSASGTVNSDPVGISHCNWQQGTCAANFSSKTVKLIASPDADSIAVFHQTLNFC